MTRERMRFRETCYSYSTRATSYNCTALLI